MDTFKFDGVNNSLHNVVDRVTYEYHAEKLRAIAKKYQAGIHYNYDAAVEKCRKKQAKKQRDDDPGGDALDLAFLKT